jgi:hypothetical protein
VKLIVFIKSNKCFILITKHSSKPVRNAFFKLTLSYRLDFIHFGIPEWSVIMWWNFSVNIIEDIPGISSNKMP